jgi:hypothetical protein
MPCPIFFRHQGWVNMWQQRQLKGVAVDQGNWTILNDGQTVKRFLTDWFYSIDSHQEQAKNSPQNTNNSCIERKYEFVTLLYIKQQIYNSFKIFW